MSNLLNKYRKWAQNIVGKKLIEVRGLIYFLDKPDFDHPQQIQLIFSKFENLLSLKCSRDGATLEFTDHPIQESNLGEYGKEVLLDISCMHPLDNYINKTLLKLLAVFSLVENAYIGIKFIFEEGDEGFFILNVGDEINILEVLPLGYEESEGIKIEAL